jgi:hypothetical protein
MTRIHPKLLIKYIYIKNLIITIIPKVRLLIPLDLYKIRPKYFYLRDETNRNTYNKEANHNLDSRSVSSQFHFF